MSVPSCIGEAMTIAYPDESLLLYPDESVLSHFGVMIP